MNLNEATAIKLYEFQYINKTNFFELVTGCGEQTEYEEGKARLTYYLKLVADSDNTSKHSNPDFYIAHYPYD